MTFGMDLQDEKTRKGSWTPDEDMLLTRSVFMFGERRWDYIARASGLKRSGKSCRMRWMNYLHPDLKHGPLSEAEEDTILQLHARWGNKWSRIASMLPGRTDNEIKNYWRSHLRKKTKEDKMQRESEAASGASAHLSAGKEDIQYAQTSSCEDNGPPINDSNRQASDDFLPQGLQIDDDDDEPIAISSYEALTSDWTSELMNSHHDHMDHRHGFNGTDSTKFSYPTWISLNSDIILSEYHLGSLWNISDGSPWYNQCGCGGDLFLTS